MVSLLFVPLENSRQSVKMGRKALSDSAKKRGREATFRKRNGRKVYIGGQSQRWKDLADRRGASDTSFAKHLLDIHDKFCQCRSPTPNDETAVSDDFSPPPGVVVSTPVRRTNRLSTTSDEDLINSTFKPDCEASHLSYADELMELDVQHEERGSSTVGMEEGDNSGTLDQTLATIGEEVDIAATEDDLLLLSGPPTNTPPEPEIPDSSDSVFELVSSEKCIAYVDCIIDLVKQKAGTECSRKKCHESLIFDHRMVGTALFVKWSCRAGHSVGKWASQPKFKMMFAGNLQIAADILLSGNSYRKIALLFSFLNLGAICESTYYNVQRLYAKPAIERYWDSMQRDMFATLQRQGEIAVAGDARNDSPGHCAQFCTYVILDQKTDAVLHLEVVDVRESTSSPVMEKIGFQRAMNFLRTQNLNVTEVVTDQNPSILKLMREHELYRGIVHQCDIWHAAKNLEKRLAAACKPRSALRQWIPAIKNHFWWSAEDCEGDTLKMKETWVRLLCHVTNQHEWADGACNHAPFDASASEERPWLEKSSPEMETLRQLVTEPRFLKMFPYFRNYRHTGAIETFNSHILMYCPKRVSYQFPGYLARNLLAAIDHNYHLNRPQQINKAGEKSFSGNYNKKSRKWTAKPTKIEKSYGYKWDLQVMVFEEKAKDDKPMKRPIEKAYDDPRRIARSIAKKPCPPIAELVRDHVSRMKCSTSDPTL